MPDDSSKAVVRAGGALGAFPRVAAFARRFGGRHAALAMHAALPLGLTSELVHLIRVNFVPSAPWIAEADLLLSPLCEEVGGGLYEMERDARELLLYELRSDPEFGRQRVNQLAEFLLAYTSRALRLTRSAERELRHFLTAEQWAALAHLRPAEAASALAAALQGRLSEQDRAGALRVARVAQALSTPLAGEPQVLLYTAGVESLAAGETEQAARLFEAVGPRDESPLIGTISLPSPQELTQVMRPRATPSDEASQTAKAETPEAETPEAEAPETPAPTKPPPLPPGVTLSRTLRGDGASLAHAAWVSRERLSETRLATTSGDERITLWDVYSGKQSRTLHASTGDVTSLDCDWMRNMVAAGLSDGTVRVWAIGEPDAAPLNLRGASGPITSVKWSKGGIWLAAASADLSVRLWKFAPSSVPQAEAGPVFRIEYFITLCLAWDEHDYLAAGLWNGEIQILGPHSEEIWTYRGHTAAVNDLAWRPDLTKLTLASASSDGTIRVWDYQRREAPPRVITGHAAAVTRVAFTHDGQFLLSKSDDRTIRVWRSEDWETVAVIDTSAAQATRPVFALRQTTDTLAACYEDDASISIFDLDVRAWLKEPPRAAQSATPHARIFISLSRRAELDRDAARQIAEGLSARGHQVSLDLEPERGTPVSAKIKEGIEQCDFVIVLLSAESVRSAWLGEEVALAESLRAARSRPRLLPVRLNYREPLPYYLDGPLGGLQQIVWEGPDDTPRVVAELEGRLRSLLSEPPDAARVSLTTAPSGPLALDSPYYVRREGDARAEESIKQAGVTLMIEGPRWSGRSSLLRRVARAAEQAGQRVALVDVAEFDDKALSDEELFFRHFCSRLDSSLGGRERMAEYWDGGRAAQSRPAPSHLAHGFMQRTLHEATSPLLLALDNLDRLPLGRAGEVISLALSWHSLRASDFAWQQLNLAVVSAPQFRRLADPKEPLSIGERVELRDFTREEAAELNRLHHSPLGPADEQTLYHRLNGHPYLTQRAIFLAASGALTADELFSRMTDDDGPFGEHLREVLGPVVSDAALRRGFQRVAESRRRPEGHTALALEQAGLVKSVRDLLEPRCRLYTEYFEQRLGSLPA
jgi:hypothetical protein